MRQDVLGSVRPEAWFTNGRSTIGHEALMAPSSPGHLLPGTLRIEVNSRPNISVTDSVEVLTLRVVHFRVECLLSVPIVNDGDRKRVGSRSELRDGVVQQGGRLVLGRRVANRLDSRLFERVKQLHASNHSHNAHKSQNNASPVMPHTLIRRAHLY